MSFHPSHIRPDVALKEYLQDEIFAEYADGTMKPVAVYSDWERPTNTLPQDFITIYVNGDIGGVGIDTPYASGYLAVSLYCKMDDSGAVNTIRIEKILEQFDDLIDDVLTENYHFEYDASRFITPTTPNQSSGYSITTLNLRWTTTSNINS